MKGKLVTIVEHCAVNHNTPSGRLTHCRVRLRDHKVVPRNRRPSCGSERTGAAGNSTPSTMIPGIGTDRERPFLLSTDIPKVGGPPWDEKLIDALSEDERLNDRSEVEEDVPSEEEQVLVEATSTTGFGELRAKQGLPWMPSTSSSSGVLTRGVDFVLAICLCCTWKSII
ncbi:hypothetical protein Cgig2_013209 [Carnegiea gigantea]|uniref:Uncharacterized protein n=1 Tax=Carnegiea gigantea TaxID=171969 RepID=A0A9Q1QLB4_9CARY|nr:hypothetical protein Cgig2_013209 [Carnegiea gigantea]